MFNPEATVALVASDIGIESTCNCHCNIFTGGIGSGNCCVLGFKVTECTQVNSVSFCEV